MSQNRQTKNEKDFLLESISEDVHELEQYIKEFSTFLPLPVALVSPTLSIIDINNAFKRASNYGEVEIMGKSVDFLFKDKRRIINFLKAVSRKKQIDHREMVFVVRDGREIPVDVSVAPRKDDNGNVVGYFIALTDISEFKKLQNSLEDKIKERTHELEEAQKALVHSLDETKAAKAEIEEERNKTMSIISNLVDPVIVVDDNWRIMLLNRAAKEVLKLSNRDLGKKIKTKNNRFSFNDFRDIARVNFKVRELRNDDDNNPLIEEVVIRSDSDASEHLNPFSVSAVVYGKEDLIYKVMTAAVYDRAGKYYGRMKIFNDLTREKIVDMLKSEFISIAAHQLRTPLSAIKWSIKMVLDGDAGELNAEQKKILWNGYISNERTINIINDMLKVSRIEEGRFGYSFTKSNFNSIVDSACKELAEEVKNKSIKLEVRIEPGLPLIYMDWEKMKLVMQNLLKNAVEYTPEYGRIKITAEKKKNFLRVSIKDNGVGIPKKEQSKLFSKFFRAENVVRMQTEGSGLGLYIVKNIITKHGGSIKCHSEEGRGTEFVFKIPIFSRQFATSVIGEKKKRTRRKSINFI